MVSEDLAPQEGKGRHGDRSRKRGDHISSAHWKHRASKKENRDYKLPKPTSSGIASLRKASEDGKTFQVHAQ